MPDASGIDTLMDKAVEHWLRDGAPRRPPPPDPPTLARLRAEGERKLAELARMLVASRRLAERGLVVRHHLDRSEIKQWQLGTLATSSLVSVWRQDVVIAGWVADEDAMLCGLMRPPHMPLTIRQFILNEFKRARAVSSVEEALIWTVEILAVRGVSFRSPS